MHLRTWIIGALLFSFSSISWGYDGGFGKCISKASKYYGLPRIMLEAVIKTENGYPGLQQQNRDGSYDLGIMQINDHQAWYQILLRQGFTRNELVNDGCKNIWAGTYILATEIYEAGSFWKGIGNYHNRREPFHSKYIKRVKKNWYLIAEQ